MWKLLIIVHVVVTVSADKKCGNTRLANVWEKAHEKLTNWREELSEIYETFDKNSTKIIDELRTQAPYKSAHIEGDKLMLNGEQIVSPYKKNLVKCHKFLQQQENEKNPYWDNCHGRLFKSGYKYINKTAEWIIRAIEVGQIFPVIFNQCGQRPHCEHIQCLKLIMFMIDLYNFRIQESVENVNRLRHIYVSAMGRCVATLTKGIYIKRQWREMCSRSDSKN